MLKKFNGLKLRKTAFLAAMVACCLEQPVYAAEAVADEPVKTRDVLVTATRTEQEVKETPSSVEVITRDDIEAMGAETLAQALKLAVGIDVLENGMVGNTVSIRGMGSNRTLIMVDGRRIRTENTDSTANAYELQRVNMDNVERIEIVRGPVSSLYGSEALGGVINIIMKHPEKQQTKVGFSATSRQTDQSILTDFGKQGKWSWQVSARHTDVKQRDDGSTSNQFGDKYYWTLDGRMDIDENKKLDVFFDYMKEDLYAHDSAKAGTSYDHIRTSTGVAYSGKDSKGDYEIRTYYTNFDKKQRTRNKADNKLTSFDNMEFNSWITDARRTIQVGDRHLVTVGGEYREEDYNSTRIGSGGSNPHQITMEGVTSTESDTSMKYTALYAQDEWLLNDKMLLIPSVRFDHSDAFGDKVTAKLGTTYKFSDDSRIKASVGSAYRAPTASELYMNWEHIPTSIMTVHVIGNPDLKPETSLNYEVSFEAEKDDNFGKLTYFNNKVSDLINSDVTTSISMVGGMHIDAYSKYVNVDEAKIQGVELEAGRKLTDKLTLKGSWTYMDAKDARNDVRLTGRAKNRATVQLAYDDLVHSGVTATLWNEWLNDYLYEIDSSGHEDAYDVSLLNFVVNKKLSDKYSVYFGVDNITDKKVDKLSIDGRIWRTGVTMTI